LGVERFGSWRFENASFFFSFAPGLFLAYSSTLFRRCSVAGVRPLTLLCSLLFSSLLLFFSSFLLYSVCCSPLVFPPSLSLPSSLRYDRLIKENKAKREEAELEASELRGALASVPAERESAARAGEAAEELLRAEKEELAAAVSKLEARAGEVRAKHGAALFELVGANEREVARLREEVEAATREAERARDEAREARLREEQGRSRKKEEEEAESNSALPNSPLPKGGGPMPRDPSDLFASPGPGGGGSSFAQIEKYKSAVRQRDEQIAFLLNQALAKDSSELAGAVRRKELEEELVDLRGDIEDEREVRKRETRRLANIVAGLEGEVVEAGVRREEAREEEEREAEKEREEERREKEALDATAYDNFMV